MCIAAFLWQAHPLYPLLLLHNRDEYHKRPTAAVEWWGDEFKSDASAGVDIVGGRDELAGGTWLACSRGGRVAFLTNVLELHERPDAKSRGELPLLFLQSCKSPREFAEGLIKRIHQYNGFNLIVADISSNTMVYITNRPTGEGSVVRDVSPGLHVLSNGNLDSPWPKAQKLGLGFKEQLLKYGEGEIPLKEIAKKLMRDRVKADRNRLPGVCSVDWELALSSIFVETDTPLLGRCGTRSTIALAVKRNGEVSFDENYLEDGTWKEKTIKYRIQNSNHDLKQSTN
ncbi:Transport and Golgi organization 2 homolog [Linum grandiflorum]